MRARAAGRRYLEFLRVPELSAGLYVLEAGTLDPQSPHAEDEVYLVVKGRGRFRAGDDEEEVGPGSVLFVPARVEHRFLEIRERLEVTGLLRPGRGVAQLTGAPARRNSPGSAPVHSHRGSRAGWTSASRARAALPAGAPAAPNALVVRRDAGPGRSAGGASASAANAGSRSRSSNAARSPASRASCASAHGSSRYCSTYSCCWNAALNAPQAVRESGPVGSSRCAASTARGWASGITRVPRGSSSSLGADQAPTGSRRCRPS